ncbi:MAG: RtcB family protein [Bacteroidia bacterium]
MGNSKIRGKHLMDIGFSEGKVIGVAVNAVQKKYKTKSRQQKLDMLQKVLQNPEHYSDDDAFWQVAKELISNREKIQEKLEFELKATLPEYAIYGKDNIEPGAIHQMNQAMKLPVSISGALMPDAHHGYGLPIGGVLATKNAVIPYGVGVDIGCRMCLSVFDLKPEVLDKRRESLQKALIENTRFGNKHVFEKKMPHAVLERDEFYDIPYVKTLHKKAAYQIGTSGGGNHFAEFGIVEITDIQNEFKLPLGTYVGFLTHSGSRGLGANIARFYTKLAQDTCRLPEGARHLSWLDLSTENGQEYWQAMNLAGDYASACHHQMHERIAKHLGQQYVGRVENHHNFAWKEPDAHGNELIVHRKGATPAAEGVLGIIPGSMTAPGFIVRGKGNTNSLNSASHGAGRVMSRTQAKQSLAPKMMKNKLKENNVTLIGGGLDEAPMAYKNIHQVMSCQTDLVEVLGSFTPKIVRMEGKI